MSSATAARADPPIVSVHDVEEQVWNLAGIRREGELLVLQHLRPHHLASADDKRWGAEAV
jgi:hypothetical protein